MPATLLAKACERGIRESLELSQDIAQARLAARDRTQRAFVFVSPPMNLSGAPLALVRVIEDFADRYGPRSIRLLSPQIHPELREQIATKGVKVERAAAVMGAALVRLQLALRRRDFVLLNTAAVPSNYRTSVLEALRLGRLSQANWYIHEDIDQLQALAPVLLEEETRKMVGALVENRQLKIYVPSNLVKAEYDELFRTKRTMILPPTVKNDSDKRSRHPDEYNSVKFLLSGRPTDGRKGHVLALAAFHEFVRSYYQVNHEEYRDFSLTLVGMTDDYIADQIVSIGTSVLGKSFRVLGEISHEESLAITRECNAVICCSFNEALPLYVLEAMSVGHIVIRNNCGGLEEQLDEGVNGFRIDSSDVRQFASVLEQVLNKRSMKNRQLQAMGRASQEMLADLRRAHEDAMADLRNSAA